MAVDPDVQVLLDAMQAEIDDLKAVQLSNAYDAEAVAVVAEFTQEVGSRTGDQRAAFITAARTFMEGYSDDPSA